MAKELPLRVGDRLLYRLKERGVLHEGLLREVSQTAYKLLTGEEGAKWFEKESLIIVEVLPKMQEKGEGNAKKGKTLGSVLNDG